LQKQSAKFNGDNSFAKKLTHFEKKVYTVIKKIPFGEVRTYAWVAKKIRKPGASRAVGNALNKNPFPIVVPCHRVVRSDGSIGKYAFGHDFKRKLLEIENAFRDKVKIKRRRN
jgi:O-6-methylguanine DNA methyltransferase